MIQKSKSSIPDHVRVTFELPASLWADRIYVTGDFNDWQQHETPLQQGHDGVWRATLDLKAGRFYEFRYLVDGQWQTDYHADGFSSNEHGSHNSLVNASLPVDNTVAVKPALHRGSETEDVTAARRPRSVSQPQLPAATQYAEQLRTFRPRIPIRSVA